MNWSPCLRDRYGKRIRTSRGNTLVLTVAVSVGLMVILGFVAINLAQFYSFHKEAQTAIDAAALQAAGDIGRVVIDGKFGTVALVDDGPPGGDSNKRSVLGINTILGTIRLDLVIANQLGNTSMIFMARQDLQNAEADARQLTTTIRNAVNGSGIARDKNGNVVRIRRNVLAAYEANSRRMGNTNARINPRSLRIVLGQLTPGEGHTNIPTPQPASADPVTQSDAFAEQVGSSRFYKPYVAVPTNVSGVNFPIEFVAVANEPRLVTNNAFLPLSQGTVPTVVQVLASEEIRELSPATGQQQTRTVRVVATAQAGGQRSNTPSGGMLISFPNGFPPNGQNVNFASVLTIMNASQLPPNATASTPSPYAAWDSKAKKGKYSQAVDGPVPGAGNANEQSYLGRQDDDPSVSLAFFTWNWLKSLGLRPNVNAVVTALSANLRAFAQAHQAGGSGQVFAHNIHLLPSAHAESQNAALPISGMMADNIDPSTGRDPREIGYFTPERASNIKKGLQNAFWGLAVHPGDLPANAGAVSVQPDSKVTTTTGDSPQVLNQLESALFESNRIAGQTFINALSVGDRLTKQRESVQTQIKSLEGELRSLQTSRQSAEATQTAELQAKLAELKKQDKELEEKIDKAATIMLNAGKVAQVIGSPASGKGILGNFLILTGLGCSRDPQDPSRSSFILGGSHVYPLCGNALTEQEVEQSISSGSATTVQASGVNPDGWLTAGDLGQGISKFKFYEHLSEPVIARQTSENGFLQSAYAASTIPQSQNNDFYFTVQGDASTPGGQGNGEIVITNLPASTFNGLSTLEGQLLYQNTQALTVQQTPAEKVQFQVIGRCQNAYSGLDDNGRETVYFHDGNAPGNINQPQIRQVVHWSVRCPLVIKSCEGGPIRQVFEGLNMAFLYFYHAGKIINAQQVRDLRQAGCPLVTVISI